MGILGYLQKEQKNDKLIKLMALIGEQFDESEEICGVVSSVRQRQDKLSLWTKTASKEAVQVQPRTASMYAVCALFPIVKKWKEIIDFNDKMVYSFHDDARREKSNRGGRYSIYDIGVQQEPMVVLETGKLGLESCREVPIYPIGR